MMVASGWGGGENRVQIFSFAGGKNAGDEWRQLIAQQNVLNATRMVKMVNFVVFFTTI